MDVLPLILSEEDVLRLPKEVLTKFSEICTDRVLSILCKYLESSQNEEVKEKLLECFERPLNIRKYSMSSSIAGLAGEVGLLTYSDIYYGLTVDELTQYKSSIESILDNKYAVAWIEPITSSKYDECLNELLDMLNLYSGEERACVCKLTSAVDEAKSLFKDPPHTTYRGTAVKKVLSRSADYRLMLRGIEFLLKQEAEHNAPSTWRFL